MAGEIKLNSVNFASESGGTVTLSNVNSATNRTNLGLGTAATSNTGDFEAAGSVSTHVALTTAHGISAFGATLVDDANAAAARTTLGLGSIATQAADNVSISGGNITGGTIGGSVVFPAGHVIKTSEYNIPRGTYTSVWFPSDDTIPQITEGTEIFSQSYTPSSAATSILIRVNNLFLIETSNVADAPNGALFISGDSNAKLVMLGSYTMGGASNDHGQLAGEVLVPSWSGAKTISVRKGTGHHAVQYWLSGGWSTVTTLFGLNTTPSATVVVQEIA